MKSCKFFLVVARDDETISDDQLLLKFAEIVLIDFVIGYLVPTESFSANLKECQRILNTHV